jgi:signal transduction histidine kinase
MLASKDYESITRQAQLFEMVARTGACLTAIRSMRRLFSEGIVLICDAFELDEVVIYLLTDDKKRITPQARCSGADRKPVGAGAEMPLDSASPIGRAMQQQRAVYVAACDQGPCELALPLICENDIGALVIRGGEKALIAADAPAFQLLADHLAVAIHNAQLHARDAQVLASAERRAKLLEAATVVGRDVTSIMDLDELLAHIVDTICIVYGFYYAAVFLVETKMKRWAVLRAAYGEAGKTMLESGYLLEIGDNSMVGWCIKHKQARIALDVGQDAVHFSNPLLPLTRSEMALPLVVGDEVIGAITIQSALEAAFDEKDVYTLQILADQVAIVINNARLLSDLRETSRELLRTKTFEAIAQTTGETIHWVGNKAAPIRACVSRTREDIAKIIYMAAELLEQAPPELREHVFAQVIRDAAETLDEKMALGRELIAGMDSQPFKKVHRLLNMESVLEDLDIIKTSAETILEIKENVIGPARETHRRKVNLDELIKKTVTAMVIPSHIKVEQYYAEKLPAILGDPRQLESVFNNLLKNSVEAMDGRPEQRLVIETMPAKTDGFVAVRITDTGCGIPKQDIDRIWISFYTTKGHRGGTGLGLSSCLQIINQMEGKIEVESEVNVGTSFTVLLPALPE